jgi:hypothetical protein
VAYLVKASIVEPEKQTLLGNGCVTRKNEVLKVVCSVEFVPRLYNEDQPPRTRVEAGSNTSIVTLQVVGGDEKEVSNLRQ